MFSEKETGAVVASAQVTLNMGDNNMPEILITFQMYPVAAQQQALKMSIYQNKMHPLDA